MARWTPYTVEYKPLAAGSIDGTDADPHDRAVIRAINANYTPSDVNSKPDRTLFVGRLPHNFSEDKLSDKFSRFGRIESVRIVRDIITGQSKGYGFVEYYRKSDADEAWRETQHLEIEGYRLIVDQEVGHTLKGWIPRRLGGGWGGRKGAGQLRFGCLDRPWRKPIILPQQSSSSNAALRLSSSDGSRRFSDSGKVREGFGHEGEPQHSRETERHRHRRDRYHDDDRHDSRQDRKDYQSSRHEGKSHRRYRENEIDRDYNGKDKKERSTGRSEEKEHFERHERKRGDYSRQKERDQYYD